MEGDGLFLLQFLDSQEFLGCIFWSSIHFLELQNKHEKSLVLSLGGVAFLDIGLAKEEML
jgi:hypothetical protein